MRSSLRSTITCYEKFLHWEIVPLPSLPLFPQHIIHFIALSTPKKVSPFRRIGQWCWCEYVERIRNGHIQCILKCSNDKRTHLRVGIVTLEDILWQWILELLVLS
ncbi:hypothetical protein NPIL_26931 [Nephila pilipes]|uniref:Uncharacterized protein n=1 Tax=Nephila pilipes TaxID=299642 RepID=A0A8X6ULU3_NEPPI|nr:hypothetical protein NPIL_26931 [Nephila pilipes]